MEKRAHYIINRFIYLGILLTVGGIVKFVFPQSLENFPTYFPIFIPAGIVSLLFGLKFRRKLKENSERLSGNSSEDAYESNRFGWLVFLGALIAVVAGLSGYLNEQSANYIFGILLIFYSIWFYKEVLILNKYLKS